MAAPGQSFASPAGQSMDGLSGMLARIKERAGRRRANIGSGFESDVIDPMQSQAAVDAMQAPNIEEDSPLSGAIRTVGRGGGGGNPFRTASMTEADRPEITEAQCEGGNCPTSIGSPVMSVQSMGMPSVPGLPPGAMVISERVVGQDPQPVGGMPMQAAQATSPYSPVDTIRQLTAEFNAKETRSISDHAQYYRDVAGALQDAARQPGVPFLEQRRLYNEAAAYGQAAMKSDEMSALQQIADQKAAIERGVAQSEQDAIRHRIEMERATTPEARMQTMRNVVADDSNPINIRTGERPEIRARLFQDDLIKSRLKAGANAQAGPHVLDPKKLEEEYDMLVGYAYAADISRLIVQQEQAKRLPFGSAQEMQNRQKQTMIMATLRYGRLDPATMEEKLLLELQPALASRMAKAETNALRASSGGEVQLPAERIAEIEDAATGHVMALRESLLEAQPAPSVTNFRAPVQQRSATGGGVTNFRAPAAK